MSLTERQSTEQGSTKWACLLKVTCDAQSHGFVLDFSKNKIQQYQSWSESLRAENISTFPSKALFFWRRRKKIPSQPVTIPVVRHLSVLHQSSASDCDFHNYSLQTCMGRTVKNRLYMNIIGHCMLKNPWSMLMRLPFKSLQYGHLQQQNTSSEPTVSGLHGFW